MPRLSGAGRTARCDGEGGQGTVEQLRAYHVRGRPKPGAGHADGAVRRRPPPHLLVAENRRRETGIGSCALRIRARARRPRRSIFNPGSRDTSARPDRLSRLVIPSYFTPFLCTLCTSPNLFRPSFGTYPHVLVGRDPLVDEFDDTFDGLFDPTGLTMLLSGQRGMGKTVLLDAYARAARAAGWLVISDASSDGLLDRLGRDHLPRLLQMHADQSHAKLTSGSISLGPLGAGGGWDDRYPAESTLRSQIAELTDALRPSGRGLVVTVDEIQSAALEELRKLGEIAKRMGVTAQYAGEYRRRLIRDGIIEPAGHGKVRFTIPYTADHLREHAAHDALEGLADENP